MVLARPRGARLPSRLRRRLPRLPTGCCSARARRLDPAVAASSGGEGVGTRTARRQKLPPCDRCTLAFTGTRAAVIGLLAHARAPLPPTASSSRAAIRLSASWRTPLPAAPPCAARGHSTRRCCCSRSCTLYLLVAARALPSLVFDGGHLARRACGAAAGGSNDATYPAADVAGAAAVIRRRGAPEGRASWAASCGGARLPRLHGGAPALACVRIAYTHAIDVRVASASLSFPLRRPSTRPWRPPSPPRTHAAPRLPGRGRRSSIFDPRRRRTTSSPRAPPRGVHGGSSSGPSTTRRRWSGNARRLWLDRKDRRENDLGRGQRAGTAPGHPDRRDGRRRDGERPRASSCGVQARAPERGHGARRRGRRGQLHGGHASAGKRWTWACPMRSCRASASRPCARPRRSRPSSAAERAREMEETLVEEAPRGAGGGGRRLAASRASRR